MTNPRILVVKRPEDLRPGWTRKAPHPPEGLDGEEHFYVTHVGEALLGRRFDVVLLTQRAWTYINLHEKARRWYDQALVCRLEPSGVIVWLWEDE